MTQIVFAGQVALVTGASRGIGAAIALELARKGLRVVGTATTEAGAAAVAQALAEFPGCAGRVLNVTDGAAADALVDAVVKEWGGIQVLVNNAGITRDNLAMRMKDDDWDAVIDANLKGVFRMSRAVMRPMMKQRYGRIISITSVVGASGNAGQANYAAAKAGVVALTQSLAKEVARAGLTVNAICPGYVMTEALAQDAPQVAELAKRVPARRLGQPEEVAAAVLYLAGMDAAYTNGAVLKLDGGIF